MKKRSWGGGGGYYYYFFLEHAPKKTASPWSLLVRVSNPSTLERSDLHCAFLRDLDLPLDLPYGIAIFVVLHFSGQVLISPCGRNTELTTKIQNDA